MPLEPALSAPYDCAVRRQIVLPLCRGHADEMERVATAEEFFRLCSHRIHDVTDQAICEETHSLSRSSCDIANAVR